MKFLNFSIFVGHFCPPGSGSGIPNPDMDPLTWLNPDPIRIRSTVQNDWPVWFPHPVPGCRGERDPSPTAWSSRRPSPASLSSARSAMQFCYKEKRNIKTNRYILMLLLKIHGKTSSRRILHKSELFASCSRSHSYLKIVPTRKALRIRIIRDSIYRVRTISKTDLAFFLKYNPRNIFLFNGVISKKFECQILWNWIRFKQVIQTLDLIRRYIFEKIYNNVETCMSAYC